MLPSHGILSDQERQNLIDEIAARGGLVNYKSTKNGLIPYELNTNYLSALADPDLPKELRAQKFLASQAILLAMPGTPGIYIHSLLGSENWSQGPELTGANRTINRKKLFIKDLEAELSDPTSLRSMVFSGYKEMLIMRRSQPALHPSAAMQVLESQDDRVLLISRFTPVQASGGMEERVTLAVNTSGVPVTTKNSEFADTPRLINLITGKTFTPGSEGTISLEPWQYIWFTRTG
jgi:sucrose phosphorylase